MKELVPWLLAPAQKGQMRTKGKFSPKWFGVDLQGYHLPQPGMALPVFLTGIVAAEYRNPASLSDAERKQRDETAKLALELYDRSRTVPAALDSALSLLLEAAKLGHPEAQLALGWHYVNRDAPQNFQTGLQWLLAASRQGVPRAKDILVENLARDENVDPELALALTEEMAAAGQLREFITLAFYHKNGRLGLKKDPAKAVEYLERGVAWQGKTEDEGYRNWVMDYLAEACFRGEGTKQDRARAAQLLRDSHMEGQSQASPGDIYRAFFYATGEHGFPRDLKKAQELLTNIGPFEWEDRKEQIKAATDAWRQALVAAGGDPKTPLRPRPTGGDYDLWSDREDALEALDAGNHCPEVFVALPTGTAGAPSEQAKVRVSVLLNGSSQVVEARVVESSDPRFNAAALADMKVRDFRSMKAPSPTTASLLPVTVMFRPKK